jgi:DNA-directed RNA polymerase specialized sigma24 family protein
MAFRPRLPSGTDMREVRVTPPSPARGTGDNGDMEELVERAAGGNEDAWRALWAALEPFLTRLISQPRFLGRLGQRDDERGNIALAVMARLRADRWHRLRLYLDARRTNPALRFESWLRVVAKRVAIDYLRAHPEFDRRDTRWIDPETLPPASELGGERPPVTDRGTARELLALAASFPADQRRALELWAHGEPFATIAVVLGRPSELDAQRLVRAAIERLRRYYREAA